MFDARYCTGRILETASGDEPKTIPIQISNAAYPITIQWETVENSASAALRLDHQKIRLRGCGKVTISDSLSNIALQLSKGVEGQVPKEFALEQNYPNPFNPSTVIRYALPVDAMVMLKIYNELGQEVSTLVNGTQEAGYQSVEWNVLQSGAASGVYFYRLEASGTTDPARTFTQVRKMLLIK